MASAPVKNASGADAGTVDLDDAVFGIEPNGPVMHQVVTAQLAARRSGTHSTKTRAEVRGGGAKPWKQKGTGRARQGSIRAPHWRGGGIAHGPKPRSYAQRTPKKMKRLALRSALSDRAANGAVLVVDDWGLDQPKTKAAAELLDAIGATGRVLCVVHRRDENVWLSLRNLPHVHVLSPDQLNAYDVLVADIVVFAADAVPAADAPPEAAVPVEPVEEAPVAEPVEEAPVAEPVAEAAPVATDEDEDGEQDEPVAAVDEDVAAEADDEEETER